MKPRALFIASLILDVGILDAVLKLHALMYFQDEQVAKLKPFLSLALHRNPGIAFDVPIPLYIVLPITLVICGVFSWLVYKRWTSNTPQALAAFAAVIGALGNGIDRLLNGFTTDYLIFFKTSAINLSDVLILLGIVGVIWYDKRIPSQTDKA